MRRLAAIGAADPSYLRLIEAHEEGTLALGSPRHCLIDPKLGLRNGRMLRTMGAAERAPIAAG